MSKRLSSRLSFIKDTYSPRSGTPSPFDESSSLNISAYTPRNPDSWFAKLEEFFYDRNIKCEEEKFYLAVLNLDAETEDRVGKMIICPPKDQPYSKLREELVSEMRMKKIKAIMKKRGISYKKPSEILEYLKSIGSPKPDDLLQSIWINVLPYRVKNILKLFSKFPLEEQAELADLIDEIPSYSEDIELLKTELSQLSEDVATSKSKLMEIMRKRQLI